MSIGSSPINPNSFIPPPITSQPEAEDQSQAENIPETDVPPESGDTTPPDDNAMVDNNENPNIDELAITPENGNTEGETPAIDGSDNPGQSEESLPEDSFPEDEEGVIRFNALRNVFRAADGNENGVVGRRELNNVDREALNKNQTEALDALLENYDAFAGRGRITLEDIRTVASLDGDRSEISNSDLIEAPDQARGRDLRQQVQEEYGIDVVGDVDDEYIASVIDSLDNLPQEIRQQFLDSGSRIELSNNLDRFLDDAEAGSDSSRNGAFAIPGFENGTAVLTVGSVRSSSSVDVVLHEVAHVLDTLGGDDNQFFEISESQEFGRLIERPRVQQLIETLLGKDSFHSNSAVENFAELFAYFHSNSDDQSGIPRSIRRFFGNLEFTI